jgi:ammonium transporter, Amt family
VLNSGDTAWVLASAALVMLMTPGLAFFYGGMVRSKSVLNMLMMNFIALAVVGVLWVFYGFSLAFGNDIGGGLLGGLDFAGLNNTVGQLVGYAVAADPEAGVAEVAWPGNDALPVLAFAMFQLMFAVITPALISGAIADRVKFWSWTLFVALWSTIVYFPVAHWVFSFDGFVGADAVGGWIANVSKLGALDFAGGTAVHINAGAAGLALAIVLGKRRGWPREPMRPHNLPFVLLGASLLWFGWFGFNAGSALAASGQAAMAFATTNTASASAALAWIFFDRMRGQKPSALGACVGAVVGLVAITPAAGYVSIGESIFIGTCASVVSNLMVHWKNTSTLDDTLDVFPCHGVGGMVGMLMTGLFAKDVGLTSGHATTFLVHCGALVFVAAFSFCGSYFLYKFTDLIIPLRVSGEQEEIGLDLSQHGEVMQDSAAAKSQLSAFAA